MKRLMTFSGMLSAFFLLNVQSTFGQNICMVTADYDEAENYIVIWEQPLNVDQLDSVFIYRKQSGESVYTKIGSQSVDELSFFTDTTSNTIVETFYRISFLDNLGNESTQSPWHRPVVMDYIDGLLTWTLYEKEGQIDETWISGYACMRDETGLGLYSTMGYWETVTGGVTQEWFDQEAALFNNFTYQMLIDMPTCAVTRANINTSRSNIKRQNSNAEAGIETAELPAFVISPNPATDFLTISLDEQLIGSDFSVTDLSGKTVLTGKIATTEMNISLNKVGKGHYLFNVMSKNRGFSKAFVKN